jgi:hypothetical protein
VGEREAISLPLTGWGQELNLQLRVSYMCKHASVALAGLESRPGGLLPNVQRKDPK